MTKSIEKRKFILDTDMGPDCDDCGALGILASYHRAGKAEILGVTHCTSDIGGAYTIAAINAWFGVDCPIGQTAREGFFDAPQYMRYTRPIMETYIKAHGERQFADSTRLLRQLLCCNDDVTLIFIGPLNNMGDLLQSGGDDISEKSGVELIRDAVREVIVMGGNFTPGNSMEEFNIACDVPSAKLMAEKCPMPVVYCGFEAGERLLTGKSLWDCDPAYPVKQGYAYYFGEKAMRSSWDLVTTYYALEPDDPNWVISQPCRVSFSDTGVTQVGEGSGARYVRYRDEDKLAEILDGILAEGNIR